MGASSNRKGTTMNDSITPILKRLADRSYYRGHLDGFLLGLFAGSALATAVMGVIFA